MHFTKLVTLVLAVGFFGMMFAAAPADAACGSKCQMLTTCYECDFSLFFSCNWKWCDDCKTTGCASLTTDPDANQADNPEGIATSTLEDHFGFCAAELTRDQELPRIVDTQLLEPRT